MHSDIGL